MLRSGLGKPCGFLVDSHLRHHANGSKAGVLGEPNLLTLNGVEMNRGRNLMPSRRQFLASTAAAGALVWGGRGLLGAPADDAIRFFVVGDTHYLADKAEPSKLDPASEQVTSALIETLNRLPGSAIPDGAGGGVVGAARGLIHAGDLIDSGDKN